MCNGVQIPKYDDFLEILFANCKHVYINCQRIFSYLKFFYLFLLFIDAKVSFMYNYCIRFYWIIFARNIWDAFPSMNLLEGSLFELGVGLEWLSNKGWSAILKSLLRESVRDLLIHLLFWLFLLDHLWLWIQLEQLYIWSIYFHSNHYISSFLS